MSVRDLLFSFLCIPHPEQVKIIEVKITLTRCPHAQKVDAYSAFPYTSGLHPACCLFRLSFVSNRSEGRAGRASF
jgi:hypothetical protein